MDKEIISKINQQVYQQFPYLNDIDPDISQEGEDKILLVFKGAVSTANGHSMAIVVRIVTDSTGKILKTSTSR